MIILKIIIETKNHTLIKDEELKNITIKAETYYSNMDKIKKRISTDISTGNVNLENT